MIEKWTRVYDRDSTENDSTEHFAKGQSTLFSGEKTRRCYKRSFSCSLFPWKQTRPLFETRPVKFPRRPQMSPGAAFCSATSRTGHICFAFSAAANSQKIHFRVEQLSFGYRAVQTLNHLFKTGVCVFSPITFHLEDAASSVTSTKWPPLQEVLLFLWSYCSFMIGLCMTTAALWCYPLQKSFHDELCLE